MTFIWQALSGSIFQNYAPANYWAHFYLDQNKTNTSAMFTSSVRGYNMPKLI